MNGKKVFVIGLGLIGGSLALAIKKQHRSVTMIGCDIDREQLAMAESLGVIDKSADLSEGVQDADLIILAAPVMRTEEIIDQLMGCTFKEGAIITDVGSTKQTTMKKAEQLRGKGVVFIGGHPLAGSHKSGVTAASARLFENAFYVLIPNGSGNNEHSEELKGWLSGTNATFIEMTAEEHDRIVGVISHFPHVVAASLVHELSRMNHERFDVRTLAAGGFRDITRIASSSPAMWHDILIHNRSVLLEVMEQWEREMDRVKSMIEKADSERIYAYFEDAKRFRDTLPQRKKGAIPPLYDLYVDIPDYPGIIAKVTEVIAQAGISITNIQIIEMREDIIGVLRVSFRSEEDRNAAVEILNEENYKTYIAD